MAASLYRIAKTACEFCAHALEGAGAGGGDSVAMGGGLVARSPRKPEIAADASITGSITTIVSAPVTTV